MNQQKEHRITIKIADADAFRLPVKESEESFYRHVIEQINNNVNRFRYGANADTPSAALAKVTLYYATMLYRQTNLINSQAEILGDFEARIDSLLEGTD
ncbi:MAG: hypothetical protein K2F91_07310 [Muribaculaceae bacterium]|nr:hypothetical protein [Muribaculaceae bacterium]MDE6197657.1 hypothetical protein [Muribaculaceae bacterium]